MKPKLAMFSFTSCEGCQLQILNLEDELLSILNAVEIVNFREAIDEKAQDYDIAFVEGSITTPEEIEEVKDIRSKAKLVVAIGACACLGGVNAMKNFFPLDFVRNEVYKEKASCFPTLPVQRVGDVIKVDYEMHGCPITKKEFLHVTKSLLLGIPLKQIHYSICTECKTAGNVCLFDKGETCIGAITRGGCDAICPTFGDGCEGCRGFVDEPNFEGMIQVLADRGLTKPEIKNKFTYFNGLDVIETINDKIEEFVK
ncbi:MAG: NADH:ubiquinone oxidoreductase [Calditrichaeota bacterium]|nr:MAG: NADH:ubiquinone oxidoreductase [Calditrichota bacterium]